MTDLDRLKAAAFEEGDSPLDTEVAPMPRMLVEVKPDPSPLALVAEAIAKGHDPSKLNALLDFAERVQRDARQTAYAKAMIACQQVMPIIVHDAQNKHTVSTYAKLETIQEQIKPIYTAHGFTLSWDEADCPKPGFARIVCYVLHEGGHIQRHQGDFPLDGTGAKGGGVMSPVQGRVSSNTYAQRDMVRSIFNLTIAGQDDDGNQFVSPQQVKQLWGALQRVEKTLGQKVPDERMQQFWGWCQVDSFDKLPLSWFQKVLDEIRRWQKAAEEQKAGKK